MFHAWLHQFCHILFSFFIILFALLILFVVVSGRMDIHVFCHTVLRAWKSSFVCSYFQLFLECNIRITSHLFLSHWITKVYFVFRLLRQRVRVRVNIRSWVFVSFSFETQSWAKMAVILVHFSVLQRGIKIRGFDQIQQFFQRNTHQSMKIFVKQKRKV